MSSINIETTVTTVNILTTGQQGPSGPQGSSGVPDPTAIDNLQSQIDGLSNAKLDAVDYVQHFRGSFSSFVALTTALPTALDGDYAHIDSGAGFDRMVAIWDNDDNAWLTKDVNVAANTDEMPEGATNLYFKSDRVRQTTLSGLSTDVATPALATDVLVDAIGKLQAQINNIKSSVTTMVVNAQTDTAYTLALTDAGNCIEMNNSAANTLTIPPNSTVAYGIGTTILIRQMGAGQTTIVAGSGVTVRNPHGTLKLSKQYASVALHKRAIDEWCIEGNLAES